jgi:WD40 repeat protein
MMRNQLQSVCLLCTLLFFVVSLSACGTMEISIEDSPTAEPSRVEPLVPTSMAPAVPASPGPTPDLSSPHITTGNADRVAGLARLGRGVVWQMALSPNGRALAVASTTGVWLYSLPALDFVRLLEGHTGQLFSVSWSPDGTQVAAGSGYNAIYIWDAVSGDLIRTLDDPDGVEEVTWSPDGAFLASRAGDGSMKVWDAVSGQVLHSLEWEPDCMAVHLTWLPNDAQLGVECRYMDGDGKVTVWNVATRQVVRVLDHTTSVHRAVWSPDGALLASGCLDGVVRVWDGRSGEELCALRDLSGQVGSVAWSSDGARLAWSGPDGGIRVWDYATESEGHMLQSLTSGYRTVLWSLDSKQLVSAPEGNLGTLQVWDVASGAELEAVDYTFVPTGMAWSPDSTRLAASSMDSTLRVWNATEGSPLYVEQLQAAIVPNVQAVAWSPDGTRLATANTDNTVRLWDAASGREMRVLDNQEPLVSVAWSPNSQSIASWSNTTVRVWDAVSGDEVHGLDHADIAIGAWSPDGARLATVSNDGQVRVWDPVTGAALLALEDQMGLIHQVVWSPDGTRLAGVSDPGMVVWDAISGDTLFAREGNNLYVASWSPDGVRLAAGTDFGKLLVWDAASGELVHTLECGSSVLDLAWSPDGTLLASASDRIRIWDAVEGRALASLEGHVGLVDRVIWSSDGALLASMGSDLAIRVWGILE